MARGQGGNQLFITRTAHLTPIINLLRRGGGGEVHAEERNTKLKALYVSAA